MKIMKPAIALLSSLIVLAPGTICFASAETQNNDDQTCSIQREHVEKTSSIVQAPSVEWDIYNTLVVYTWKVGAGGDKLYMDNGWNQYWDCGDVVYTEWASPFGSNLICHAENYRAKSYNSVTGEFSSIKSLEHVINIDGDNYVAYGEQCRYETVDEFEHGNSYVIPTKYDQSDFIWNHNSSNGHIIKGTIIYGDKYADIEVTIPWIAYRTSSVSLDGVTFSLRTGPNRCSIKVDKSNISTSKFIFKFGIE